MCWTNKYDKCISCGTVEWKHKSKGLCTKCHPLIELKNTISKWDSKDINTFIGIPKIDYNYLTSLNNDNKLDKLKDILLGKINSRIKLYASYNNPENIQPIDIELKLEEISKITNNISNKKLFHSCAASYDNVSDEARSIIYRNLAYILINRRFDLDFAYDLYH